MSSASTAEPIEMPVLEQTRVEPRNHTLDGVQILTREGTFLREHVPVRMHSLYREGREDGDAAFYHILWTPVYTVTPDMIVV